MKKLLEALGLNSSSNISRSPLFGFRKNAVISSSPSRRIQDDEGGIETPSVNDIGASETSSQSDEGEEGDCFLPYIPADYQLLFLTFLSAGLAGVLWQLSANTMADHFDYYQPTFPSIDDPEDYWDDGFYFLGNAILGISGGVGAALPLLWHKSGFDNAFDFFVSTGADFLWQTNYDFIWYFVRQELGETQYPTDNWKHGSLSAAGFLTILTLTHFFVSHLIKCCLSDKKRKIDFTNSVMVASGSTGFMMGTEHISNPTNYKSLGATFLYAGIARLTFEIANRFCQHVFKSQENSDNSENEGCGVKSLIRFTQKCNPVTAIKKSCPSLCAKK